MPDSYTTDLSAKYHAYAVELFAEAMTYMAKYLRAPEEPRGFLINTLEKLICSLREEPYRPITEYERRLQLRSLELLNLAYASLNGPDTTEGRAKLYTLVEELRRQ